MSAPTPGRRPPRRFTSMLLALVATTYALAACRRSEEATPRAPEPAPTSVTPVAAATPPIPPATPKKSAPRPRRLKSSSPPRAVDHSALSLAVRERAAALSTCSAPPGERNEVTAVLHVRPTGKVSSATLLPASVSATPLGRCLKDAMRSWSFPDAKPAEDVELVLRVVARSGS